MWKIKEILRSLFGANPRKDHRERVQPVFPASVTRNTMGSRLRALTRYPIWDWECFRGVLICLATMGTGHYVPASQRPDGVYLDGLHPTFRELRAISAQRQGRETSRVVLVDRERSCLIISGITYVGSTRQVRVSMATQPGRAQVQSPILTIHVHPNQGGDVGFSSQDYVNFLSDQRQIVMAICCQGGVLLAMKTSSTPRQVPSQTAERMISLSRDDITSIWSKLGLPNPVLSLNKAICTEFGMTLYQTKGTGMARRIDVTTF